MSIPQQFYLYGSSQDVTTRAIRRGTRFGRQSYYLGGISIRPGRRVAVNTEFLSQNLEEILGHIQRGTLQVRHSADSLDSDELIAIATVFRGESGPIQEELSETHNEEPEVLLEIEGELSRDLPEGFTNFTKKQLIALCNERGILLESPKMSNESLLQLLYDWRNG